MIVKMRDHLAGKKVGGVIPQDQAPKQLDAIFFISILTITDFTLSLALAQEITLIIHPKTRPRERLYKMNCKKKNMVL